MPLLNLLFLLFSSNLDFVVFQAAATFFLPFDFEEFFSAIGFALIAPL